MNLRGSKEQTRCGDSDQAGPESQSEDFGGHCKQDGEPLESFG